MINRISAEIPAVLTQNHLAPHLSQRTYIKALFMSWPLDSTDFAQVDVTLLDRQGPLDRFPQRETANQVINFTIGQLQGMGLTCEENTPFVLCQKPQ